MKRLMRWAVNGLTALSLVLFVSTAIFWALAHNIKSRDIWTPILPQNSESNSYTVWKGLTRYMGHPTRMFPEMDRPAYNICFYDDSIEFGVFRPIAPSPLSPVLPVNGSYWSGLSFSYHPPPLDPLMTAWSTRPKREYQRYAFFGIIFLRQPCLQWNCAGRGDRLKWTGVLTQVYLRFSSILALTSLPLLIRVAGWANRRRIQRARACRARADLCPICGYDLRATPARCPECGAPIAGR